MNWGDDSWLGKTPRLPVRGTRSVATEVDNPDSVLRWCQRLIALRRAHSVFRHGAVEWDATGFWRRDSDSQWYIVLIGRVGRFHFKTHVRSNGDTWIVDQR